MSSKCLYSGVLNGQWAYSNVMVIVHGVTELTALNLCPGDDDHVHRCRTLVVEVRAGRYFSMQETK